MKYIYKIECKVNKRVYIGQTVNHNKRFNEHKNDLKSNRHNNPYLQEDFNKYGLSNFLFEIIEEIQDSEDSLNIEDRWINYYGGIDSDKTYNAASKYHKNKLFCSKLSSRYKGICFEERYGKEQSDKIRKINSDKHKGKSATYIPNKGKVRDYNGNIIIVTEQIYNTVKNLRHKGLTYKKIAEITNIKEDGVRNIILDNIHLLWKCND